jgi:hypothetical protein
MMNDEACTTLVSMKAALSNFENFFLIECEDTNNIICHIRALQDAIDAKLKSDCNHEYTEDMIDISPEKSEKITYCEKCFSCFSGKNKNHET